MNTEQLRYFVSVARYRNFTETAREFYVTQPAVTHQISALEREVGARLFLRTTRNVSLTRAGELFLEDAKRILAQEERAPGPPAPAGVLRMLGAAHRLPQFPLPPLFAPADRRLSGGVSPGPRGAHPAGRHRHPGGHRRGGL